jgi:hypothetical protein
MDIKPDPIQAPRERGVPARGRAEMSGEPIVARGKLQRAILDLLGRTEVVKDGFGRPTQYRFLWEIVGELHEQIGAPRTQVPHAFDVSVRRAMRTLEARGFVQMQKLLLRGHAMWACWLRGHNGPLDHWSYTHRPIIGAELRRSILECLRDMGPGDPRRGHPYNDVFEATGKRLGRSRSKREMEDLRGPFSKAVRRLADEGHIRIQIDGRSVVRFIMVNVA